MNLTAFIEPLGWMLIHSLWQFAVIALLTGGIAWTLRRHAATVRYAVLVTGMTLMVLAPIVTWMLLPASHADPALLGPSAGMAPEPVLIADSTETPAMSPSLPSETLVVQPLPNDPFPGVSIPPVVPDNQPAWTERAAETLRPWMAWIVAGWSFGVVLFSLRPLLGWRTLRRLRTIGVSPVAEDIQHLTQRVSQRLGLPKVVTVLHSTLCQTPMVLGYFRPVIFLPVSLITNMPPAQLEAILAHELAHIRRHDFVINLLQTLVETLCFYHPAVWWLSRRIRIEREHCCDDLVIAAFNNRADYGRALLAVEELRGERTVLALGVNDGSLLSRIRRIVGLHREVGETSPWSILGVVVGIVAAVTVALLLASQPPVQAQDEVTETAEVVSGEEKSNPLPARPLAELPDGHSLEFVGITKNTAPAKDGWQPNGLPLDDDLGNWKSTIVLHNKNTSSSYTEGKLDKQPDDDAIDFLFRFRGLKSQPSLTFDMPTRGSSYSHLPVQDPYELRISAWKRDPQPLPEGARHSHPDGVVTVGLTDEPWGRWVKITPDGEVPEPVQPSELYASTYRLIDVHGAVPHDRAPTGKAILIREPSGNRDPDDPWHRFAFEFRAIDTDGKDHWALMWQSEGFGRSNFVDARYGVSNAFPKDKTLSHYEFRLRPYRHWVTFENVSLEPGTATKVKVSTRTVRFDPAEKLADHFSSALRAQKLPILDDAKIAVLSGELLDTLRQRPPRGTSEEQLQKLREEFSQRGVEPIDALPRLRFYYAGLTRPALTPERWKMLTDGIAQFVHREFDPREKDAVYLAFRDRFDTLQLYVAAFLASLDATPDQADALQDQRAWMKQEIFKLPESPKFRLTHGSEIDKLQALIDDPLNPFFSRPLSDTEFVKVQELYAQSMSRIPPSDTRLNMVILQLVSALVDARANPLREAWPVKTNGWNRSNTRWTVHTARQEGNHSLHLNDRHERSESIYVDIPTMTFVNGTAPSKLEEHAAWLQQQGKGDLAYDAKADAFIAVRGAKLAVLNAASWYAADLVPMADLRRLIQQNGVESIPMSAFVKPSTIGDNRVRDLRDNPPSLVVQTQEGKIAVVRLFTFGPVIQSHLRPLPPNPPLHPGDIVPTQVRLLDATGNPATFNALITAQAGYTKKPKPHWIEWRDKTGLVSLEMLPHGKHWIVAAPEFEQRTIFPVTYPMPENLVEWRLRSSEMWTQRDYEFKPRFEPNEKNGDIVVNINNKYDKPLTVSEADFSLHVGETAMYRAMSPQWADTKFQTIEIPAKETGEIRLNWDEWVRNGFWASRESETISEPTLPPDEPGRIYVRVNLGNSGALPIAVTDPALILTNPKPESSDERTSLLESLINDPRLETFRKLLALTEGEHAEVTELLDDARRHSGKEKMGGEVRVINNGKERFAIVSAKVIPIIKPADVPIVVDPERRAECAFIFDMQGRLIDTIGGKLAAGNSLNGDNIHVVNLGPEEDWFVRVMNFEKRGELNYRSDYYRIANPVVKSMRFYNLPNACSWSNGPEKIPRQGRLHPSHPQASRPSYAGIIREIPVTTAAGVPTLSAIVWDGDRNRFIAAPSAFVKGLPLYQIDAAWSQEFEPLEPQAGQLTVEGSIREFDHWFAWETTVPEQNHAFAVLAIPQREGAAKTIEKKLAPGRHIVQLQAKPNEKGSGVKLKLWIDDDQKYDFDLPFDFGEPLVSHPPIVQVLSLNGPTPNGGRFGADAVTQFLVQRPLKETAASFTFGIKLSKAAVLQGEGVNSKSAVKGEIILDDNETRPRGTLFGRFVYDGEAPQPRVLIPTLPIIHANSDLPRDSEGRVLGVAMAYQDYLRWGIRPKTPDLSLLVDKTGGIANVVIWVTNKEIPYVPKDHLLLPATITVLDGHFHPHITKMLAGQRLHVVNGDPVAFQFHADFHQNTGINVLLPPKQKDEPFRTLIKDPEPLPVPYRSDIATWATGFILVRPNTYIAVSQADGTFTMPDLPPGEWEFRVWHERNGYVTHWPMGKFTQKIVAGDNHLGNIRLKPELFAERVK